MEALLSNIHGFGEPVPRLIALSSGKSCGSQDGVVADHRLYENSQLSKAMNLKSIKSSIQRDFEIN